MRRADWVEDNGHLRKMPLIPTAMRVASRGQNEFISIVCRALACIRLAPAAALIACSIPSASHAANLCDAIRLQIHNSQTANSIGQLQIIQFGGQQTRTSIVCGPVDGFLASATERPSNRWLHFVSRLASSAPGQSGRSVLAGVRRCRRAASKSLDGLAIWYIRPFATTCIAGEGVVFVAKLPS